MTFECSSYILIYGKRIQPAIRYILFTENIIGSSAMVEMREKKRSNYYSRKQNRSLSTPNQFVVEQKMVVRAHASVALELESFGEGDRRVEREKDAQFLSMAIKKTPETIIQKSESQ